MDIPADWTPLPATFMEINQGPPEVPLGFEVVDESAVDLMEAHKKTEAGIPEGSPVRTLGNFIAEGESPTWDKQKDAASAYDVTFGYGKHISPNKPITQMTLGEVYEFGRQQIYATKGKIGNPNPDLGTSAVGKYQFTRPTMVEVVNNNKELFGGSWEELKKKGVKFDALFQDRLLEGLLKMEGLDYYLSGEMSEEHFIDNVASRWQSFPNSKGKYLAGKTKGLSLERAQELVRGLKGPEETPEEEAREFSRLEPGVYLDDTTGEEFLIDDKGNVTPWLGSEFNEQEPRFQEQEPIKEEPQEHKPRDMMDAQLVENLIDSFTPWQGTKTEGDYNPDVVDAVRRATVAAVKAGKPSIDYEDYDDIGKVSARAAVSSAAARKKGNTIKTALAVGGAADAAYSIGGATVRTLGDDVYLVDRYDFSRIPLSAVKDPYGAVRWLLGVLSGAGLTNQYESRILLGSKYELFGEDADRLLKKAGVREGLDIPDGNSGGG